MTKPLHRSGIVYTKLINKGLSALLLLLAVHFQAAGDISPPDASVTIAMVEAIPGEHVIVPVTAVSLNNIIAFNFSIQFNDQVLYGANPVLTNIHPALSGLAHNLLNDSLLINWFSAVNPVSIPSGAKLFDMVFTFCNNFYSCAENQTESDLIFINSSFVAQFVNGDFVILPVDFNNGNVFADPPLNILAIFMEGEGNVLIDGNYFTGPLVDYQGTEFLLEASPAAAWTFLYWAKDSEILSTENPLPFTLEENTELTALFVPDLTHTLTFHITGTDGMDLPGAAVNLGGMDHAPGEHIFYDLPPGLYSYVISMECFTTFAGQLIISDDDHQEYVQLENLPGDANGDGAVSVADIVTVAAFLSADQPDPFCYDNADANGDGLISVADIVMIANLILGQPPSAGYSEGR